MIEVHCVCCNGFFDVYKREHVSAAFIFTCLLTSYCHLVHYMCHNIIYIYMILIIYITILSETKHRTTKEGWTWFLIHFDSRLLVSGGPSHLGQTTPYQGTASWGQVPQEVATDGQWSCPCQKRDWRLARFTSKWKWLQIKYLWWLLVDYSSWWI